MPTAYKNVNMDGDLYTSPDLAHPYPPIGSENSWVTTAIGDGGKPVATLKAFLALSAFGNDGPYIAKVEYDHIVDANHVQGDDFVVPRMRLVHVYPIEATIALSALAARISLHYFEEVFPYDRRPRRAMDAALNFIETRDSEEAQAAAIEAEAASEFRIDYASEGRGIREHRAQHAATTCSKAARTAGMWRHGKPMLEQITRDAHHAITVISQVCSDVKKDIDYNGLKVLDLFHSHRPVVAYPQYDSNRFYDFFGRLEKILRSMS